MPKNEELQLEAVNARLIDGQGWIGRLRTKVRSEVRLSKFLYFQFRPNANSLPKRVNTRSNDPEEAYRQLLLARQHVQTEGNRLLPQEVGKLRYEDLIKLLMDHYRDKGAASLSTRKTEGGGTEETFQGKDYLDTFFSRMPITEITATKIKEYIAKRRRDGVLDPSIRRELGNLSRAFSVAKDLDLLTDNHIPSFPMPKDSDPREGFMELKEFDKFQKAFPDYMQLAILFLYYTGCRSGAAKQITWGMVNAECDEIHAPGRIIKNRKDWIIPLVGPLQPIADALKKLRQTAIQASDAPVFDFTNFRKIWDKICLKFNLEDLHVHDFRRSAARNLRKKDVSEQVAMKITGHKTTSIFRRYNIQNDADVREALIKVSEPVEMKRTRKAGK